MFLKIFSLLVLVVLVMFVVGILIALAVLPGRVASARNHSYTEAINVAGWVSIFTGGLLWPLVLVWAYATPGDESGLDYSTDVDEL